MSHCAIWCLLCLTGSIDAGRLNISDRYSPWNGRRAIRPHTRYLVLHTTEGGDEGALKKLWRRGEAHYLVMRSGKVHRLIHKSRIARHAGRSLWEGRANIDNYSIGIEVVGYHDREITPEQYSAVGELVRQLKSLYRIPDERVLTHSMVAYGLPNQFHPYRHRGRKRCGMIFAIPEVRDRLGIRGRPAGDLDVEAGQIQVADRELFEQLYLSEEARIVSLVKSAEEEETGFTNVISAGQTAWQIARDAFNDATTLYVLPDRRPLRGDQITDWKRVPAGTTVLVGQRSETELDVVHRVGHGDTAWSLAGEAYASSSTIYLFPNGLVRTGAELMANPRLRGLLERLPLGTQLMTGYVFGGYVKGSRPPVRIAGRKWNYPSTIYRLPDGRFIRGSQINPRKVPGSTLVFFEA